MALADAWGKIVEGLLSGMDRLTHTTDRRRANLRASRRGRPRRIVVVCYGNICRSPYAAACLRLRLSKRGIPDVQVESAGLFGPGRPADPQAAGIALQRGLDLGDHRSRLFRNADSEHSDLVLVMTRSQRDLLIRRFGVHEECIELLGDFDVGDPPVREISDPYGRSDDEFKRGFAQVERSIEGLCLTWADQGASQGGPEPAGPS